MKRENVINLIKSRGAMYHNNIYFRCQNVRVFFLNEAVLWIRIIWSDPYHLAGSGSVSLNGKRDPDPGCNKKHDQKYKNVLPL